MTEITPDAILGFGLMNKISTGHSLLDMVLCFLVPIALRSFVPWALDLFNRLFTRTPKPVNTFSRTIEFTKNGSYWWYDGEDGVPSNSILQRALLNYVNTQCAELVGSLSQAEFTLKRRPKAKVVKEADGEEEVAEEGSHTGAEHDYCVDHVPLVGVYVDLKNGVRFMRQQEETQDGQQNKSKRITYYLESDEADGNVRIEEFVTRALALWKEQEAGKVDPARYLYIPVLSAWSRPTTSDGDNSSAPGAVFKRYKLSEEKRFDAFFHPDKSSIIGLVDQFQNRTGKFSIAGYPQKLGFLLYGPPGTGKTSFIKALGQYTKRSIISIPLSKIRTNQELMDLMHDRTVKVEGHDSGVALGFSKTIFVLEDVDAASHVVQRRDVGTVGAASALALAAAVEQEQRAAWESRQAQRESASGSTDSDASDGEGEAEGSEGGAAKKRVKKPSQGGAVGAAGGMEEEKVEGPSMPLGVKFKGIGPAIGRGLFDSDELNLAGLLNVLDGVVDTPQRLIVMTTNHPEKLDPALIRPGRINKRIFMGRIRVEEALSMIRHYFGASLPKQAEARLRAVFVDEALSPAELETMCADYDEVEQLVAHLETKFGEAGAISTPTYARAF